MCHKFLLRIARTTGTVAFQASSCDISCCAQCKKMVVPTLNEKYKLLIFIFFIVGLALLVAPINTLQTFYKVYILAI